MKNPLWFFILILLTQASYGVSDSAYFKVGENIYFKSDVMVLKKKVEQVECLFGETLVSELSKKVSLPEAEVLLFRLKLFRYVEEMSFSIDDSKLAKTLKGSLKRCFSDKSVIQKDSILKSAIVSEIYFQEYLLGSSANTEKVSAFRRMKRLLDKRIPHFIYEQE